MKTFAIVSMLLLVAVPATVLASGPGGHGPGARGPPSGAGGGPGEFGMPDASLFGLCTAWKANEKGRENGNAGSAPPFQWLQDQAEANDQTVEEYCSQYTRPGPP